MNEIVKRFLLVGEKCMPEIHLWQPEFTYRACKPFTKDKERIQELKEIEDSQYIYQNELDKAYFQHDMAYEDFNNLTRRTASDKILLQWFIVFFNKKASSGAVKNENTTNQELAKELRKQIIRKLE